MTSAQRTQRDRNLKKLPELAYVYVADEDVLCLIERGQEGYHRTDFKLKKDPEAFAKTMNLRLGVTPAQAEAMAIGSMIGWHVLGADPTRHEVLNK